jgi:RNA polymerase sigma factor (sigma-70 family)
MKEDSELLRDYVRNGAEDAFAELVRRRLGLVYRVALRKVNGDTHLAEEVAQGVFTDLARKAAMLAQRETLAGWLFTSAHFAATKAVRTAERRRHREQKAQIVMHELSSDPAPVTDWESLRPMLDDLIRDLTESDREALLLRFYEEKDYEQIGTTLRLSPNGARSRVERALQKIRASLAGRGISSTEAAVIAALESQSLFAAPANLASTVAATALANASSAIPLATAAFLMNKTILAGAAAMLAIGFAFYQREQMHRLEDSLQHLTQDRAALQAKLDAGDQRALVAERRLVALQRERSAEAPVQKAESATPPAAPASSAPAAANVPPEERAKLHERYDPFLIRFGLTAEQRDRFVELKLEIAEAQHDLQVAVEENGALGNSRDVEALREQATKPMWDEIHQLLGPEGSETYLDYERTSAYRPAIVEIFKAARVEISDDQTDQVTRLVLQAMETYHEKPTDISSHVRIDWNAVAHNAENMLTPAQLAVIRARAE